MTAENIVKIIGKHLNETLDGKDLMVSHTMYDPNDLQGKVSLAVLERIEEKGYYKRFMITVDDRKPKNYNKNRDFYQELRTKGFTSDQCVEILDWTETLSIHVLEGISNTSVTIKQGVVTVEPNNK